MKNSAQNDLKTRIIFTLLVLVVCRIGSFVPVAGINTASLAEFAASQQAGLLGMFNVLSGGSLARMSIFALAIAPYITASIIIQLLSISYKPLDDLKKEGEVGRKKINQISRTLTVILAAIQAYGLSFALLKTTTIEGPIVIISPTFFLISSVVTMVVGTMLLMWFGEQISTRGIGNGASLIIFVGIVSGLPSAFISTFELARKGSVSPIYIFGIIILVFLMIFLIIFFERAQRKVLVQYPKRQVGNKIYGGDSTYIPLKLNTSGVIPPIFAGAILTFPATIGGFTSNTSSILGDLMIMLSRGKPLYMFLSASLILFFSFFYTSVVFNSEETANNLRKYGAYVPGRRPGPHTAEYFDYLLSRLTVLGASYLCIVCLIPEIIATKVTLTFALGGTSMLIVVNVVLDTFAQIQTYMFSSKYEHAIKKIKVR